MELHTIFVYGTLMRGFHNHYLIANCEFLGPGRTKEKYCLRIDNGLPFVLRHTALSQIHGELYKVDDLTLQRLDILEKHPLWYERRQTEIVYDNWGRPETITSWMYFNDNATGIDVPSGTFSY